MNGFLKKAGLGAALAATALVSAAPADAQRWGGYRHYGHRGGDAAGAAIVGGILGLGVGAAIASSNRDRYYDRGYYYAPPPEPYYYDDYRPYYPRCWTSYRWDPYWGRDVPVRVCR
ncbi:MAG: hypothetical protein P0Y64_01800 [Candidatus Sphingomonas colombiensis]|nr:hypothetical protein [Sphingomonas sp.]WEK43590.1 MAG: hypothetical protein P0Y64_01800 [Sphingomonas sp.]